MLPFVPTKVEQFFRTALPADVPGHTLVLGEYHNHAEHLSLLQKALPALVREQKLRTLGVEYSAYLNVFCWAYQDGVLEKECGSKEAAQRYFHSVMAIGKNPEFIANVHATADLLMDAMDQGVCVVAYDTRHLHTDYDTEQDMPSQAKSLAGRVKALAKRLALTDDAGNDALRQDDGLRKQVIGKNKLAQKAWQLSELKHLCAINPAYVEKLETMETLITLGYQKGIGSDALSATLFYAAAPTEQNALVIGGFSHMDGVGNYQGHQIDGTFPDHLSLLQQEGHPAPQITRAILATTTVLSESVEKRQRHYARLVADSEAKPLRAFSPSITMLDAEKDTMSLFPTFPLTDVRVVTSLNERLWPHRASPQDTELANPLLVPSIRAMASRIHQQWQPHETQMPGLSAFSK